MNLALPDWSLSCSSADLYTLASLLGGEMLIGVPDPFPGWLTEEIQAAMHEAIQSLTASGVLSPRGEGLVVMDVGVAALVGTLVAPQAAFILTVSAPDQPARQRNIYHRAPLTVAMEPRQDQWALWFLPDTDAIVQQVREFWALGSQKPMQASPFVLPASTLERVRQGRSGEEQALQGQLEAAGVPGVEAEALALTLSRPVRNGALVAICSRQGIWDTGGLGVLEGEDGLWMLRTFSRQNTQWVECIPRSAQQLMSDTEALLKRFLPSSEV